MEGRAAFGRSHRQAEGGLSDESPYNNDQGVDACHARAYRRTLNRLCPTKRCNLPKVKADCSPKALIDLAQAVVTFSHEWWGGDAEVTVNNDLREGRYHHIRIWSQSDVGHGKVLADVAYLYDPVGGTLELYASGNKQIRRNLRLAFYYVILHKKLDDDDPAMLPFRLNPLMDRNFPFLTDPEDGILEVGVTKLRICFIDDPRRRFSIHGNPSNNAKDIHDGLDLILDKVGCSLSMWMVLSADIRMVFDNSKQPGPPTRDLTFRLKYPDLCSLKDSQDELLARKYLKRWGLERG